MCPAPAPPPACGRLPRLDHSTITLPGSTRLAPDTHHWSHITPSQPVSRWPVPMFRQSPVCWPAQCPGCGEQQRPTKTIIPWLPPHRRPWPGPTTPSNYGGAGSAVQYSVYSVYSTVCTVAMNVESRGWRNVRWQRPPPLHPLTIWGARPGTSSVDSSPGGDNDAEIRISCILCLVLCCHIFTSYLLCARTDDTRLLTV